MKKNWFCIVGILLVVVGAVLSYFAQFPLSDVTGFAVSMFGAGIAAASFWSKKTKVSVFSVATIVCLGVGAFMLGFGGFAETTMTTIISSVIGIVAIIAGIITGVISTKDKSEEPAVKA